MALRLLNALARLRGRRSAVNADDALDMIKWECKKTSVFSDTS